MKLSFVAYYRVSTKKQEERGAGLRAQRHSVEKYIQNQPKSELISEYTETESGKKKNRPQLAEALKTCRKYKAILLIAKLDRLARNVHFISGLLESKIDFIACDMPNADKTMLQIMAVFAEHERDAISNRIKEALAERKKQGIQLGVTGKDRARENKAEANRFAYTIEPFILELAGEGITKVSQIVRELNERKIPTPRSGKWHRSSVYNLLKRINV